MPLLAFGLAVGFKLPPEVTAGVILVGCCPSGTASNVMTFLARGNVALSIAITSCTTLLAPFVTPALILLLASKWLPVSAGDMFWSVVSGSQEKIAETGLLILLVVILHNGLGYLLGYRVARDMVEQKS